MTLEINVEKNFVHGLWRIILEDQKGCIGGYEEFKYLGVKIHTQENDINNRINKGKTIISMNW